MNIPRPEYPRPRMVRDQWMNLNGKWQFEFDFGDSGKYKELWKEGNGSFDREILVPFVPESKLSKKKTGGFCFILVRQTFSPRYGSTKSQRDLTGAVILPLLLTSPMP